MIAIVLYALAIVFLWSEFRKKAVSEKLLAPIIHAHRVQHESNLRYSRLDIASFRGWVRSACSNARAATSIWNRAMSLPEQPSIWKRDRIRESSFKARESIRCLDSAIEELRNATFHDHLSQYHLHTKQYYEGLLKARAAELPPFPATLAAERKAVEQEQRRLVGEATWDAMEAPPPTRLKPGAPALRPYGRPATALETTL